MDRKQIASLTKLVIELIDKRIGKHFKDSNLLQELPASVIAVNNTTGKATVRMLDDSNTEMTLYNKSGEVLHVDDTVFICWRGRMATNTAYIGRRSGASLYPYIKTMTQEAYNNLTTKEANCLYVIVDNE